MTRRLPQIKTSSKILIICEGSEEYDYIHRIIQCSVWSNSYSITLKNAKSIDNIFPLYQYYYNNFNYDLILIFCDTEVQPFSQFLNLTKSIDNFHDNNASKKIVLFANPCTMQLILSHFAQVSLTSNQKSINAQKIKQLTGIDEYKATENQRENLMNKINSDNYKTMMCNISTLPSVYSIMPSTNISSMFKNLESDSISWIKDINKKIES